MEAYIKKDDIKKQYAKIASSGNSESCCMTSQCGCRSTTMPAGSLTTTTTTTTASRNQVAKAIRYDEKDLESIPKESILGVGCGAPLNFADIKDGELVVDLGSGAGIDVFLSAKRVGAHGRVIGIDMTDEMLEKAKRNAKVYSYLNVEFRKGDIEKKIPVKDNTADLVISNCVINLTIDKVNAFREVYRVLKQGGGRMVISDLVTDSEVGPSSVSLEKWCSCLDGALTKEHYLDSIKKAGFQNVKVLSEQLYMDGEQVDGRKITSIVIRAEKI
jgi:arsenite methyltransferase